VAELEVVEEVLVRTGADALWCLVADPAMAQSFSPRAKLVDRSGTPGEVGSSFELDVRVNKKLVLRQRVRVVEAARPARLVWACATDGAPEARQEGVFSADGAGVRLRWTVRMKVPRLLLWGQEKRTRHELVQWLDAVRRTAEAEA
jgi:hypothetical protein